MKDIVVISGGANGLGFELAKQLITKDYYVCILDWDNSSLSRVQSELVNNYNFYLGDVSDEAFVNETINDISKLGNIVALINDAGEPSFKNPTEYNKNDILKCFKGLEGMILLSSIVLKAKSKNDLKIINIMSSAALKGKEKESVYCATKWGERGYTESLKVAYKDTSVKIYGVYPGGINTDFYKNSRDYVSLEKQQTFMNPIDVAETIINNCFNNANLIVSDIIIERN